MKAIENTGLILYLAAFGLFAGLFFAGDYRLTDELVREAIRDEKQQTRFIENASFMMEQIYEDKFGFISDLNKAFASANTRISEDFAIKQGEVETIIAAASREGPLTFSLSEAQKGLEGDEHTLAFKQKILSDYGGWLDGRSYSTPDGLRSNLQETVDNINRDIVKQRGFNRYTKKRLVLTLTRRATVGLVTEHTTLLFILTFVVASMGGLLYNLPKLQTTEPGIQNDGIFFSKMKNRGWLGIATGTFLILFYVLLYFYPEYMTNWIILADPLSNLLNGGEASEFFLYGFIYTLCILVMGVRMLIRYRHSRYHIIRTLSVMFFQTAFAFLIPEVLVRLNYPYYDFKNIWPLDYDFFFSSSLNQLIEGGTLGMFMLVWGIILIIIAVPLFVFFFGKRWYCSWVCGCGGLAETLGDPYRQLSDKSLVAWKIERWTVHGVLVLAVVMTAGVLYTFFTGASTLLGISTYTISEWYGFAIGAMFAGVVGTGFYPFMGNRVWCRFGCPLAAYLGIVQRFRSRFRITTNGGQCISCGNCSTYCEMGIDVRWYAQRGQNIIRSSCVGCGVCASVCPRGVLKLENDDHSNRFDSPILIGNDSVRISE
ncbi:4Fe-4S binding protein [Roseivirga sp. BDSF3-8]|uniref:4Fe-4S binding protein n=1 Tax=Roseivirga sp. BDSF3-8 TaxID=3241598 RepID=UPI003531D690